MTKTAKDLFMQERNKWLEEARDTARKLLSVQAFITIEDVLKLCPRPQYVHPNTTGSVFVDKDFVSTGYRRSVRRSMNGREVKVWTLRR